MTLEKVSISVQIDGKPYFVLLPEESEQVLILMAAGLCDGGRLKVIAAPEGFSFTSLKDCYTT